MSFGERFRGLISKPPELPAAAEKPVFTTSAAIPSAWGKNERSPESDVRLKASLALQCRPDQIAFRKNEIGPDTKAYIGPLSKEIFQIPNLENIYTSFPDGKVNYLVEVNYGQPLDQQIAAGKYDSKNNEITAEHFPASGEGEKKLEVLAICFNKSLTTAEAEKQLDDLGLRPATLEELLSLGATNPDLQRKFPIAALGSGWASSGRERRVPSLDGSGAGRGLFLSWGDFGYRWDGEFRFLAVRKSPALGHLDSQILVSSGT